MGRKRKNYYFTDVTEKAIIRYNNEKRPAMRNRIYNDHIRDAFDKLCENIIHTFKFYYFDVPLEQVKHEVVSFMVLQIPKYKPNKGRAFSYFSIVGKNYLILNNNNNYKKLKSHSGMDVLDKEKNVNNSNTSDFKQLTDEIINYFENNVQTMFKKKRDLNIAYSILDLMKQIDEIENFNKKALYIMIREMTGSNTQKITRVINQMKRYYFSMLEEFSGTGGIDTSNTGSIF